MTYQPNVKLYVFPISPNILSYPLRIIHCVGRSLFATKIHQITRTRCESMLLNPMGASGDRWERVGTEGGRGGRNGSGRANFKDLYFIRTATIGHLKCKATRTNMWSMMPANWNGIGWINPCLKWILQRGIFKLFSKYAKQMGSLEWLQTWLHTMKVCVWLGNSQIFEWTSLESRYRFQWWKYHPCFELFLGGASGDGGDGGEQTQMQS